MRKVEFLQTPFSRFSLRIFEVLTKTSIRIFVAICLSLALSQGSLFAQTENTLSVNSLLNTSTENYDGLMNWREDGKTGIMPSYASFPVLNEVGSSQFFVSPDGSSLGDGSINRPWNLDTALGQPSTVGPGAVIWLRGGTYVMPSGPTGFLSNLTGSETNPIKVLSYPGEWAVIDGNVSTSAVKNVTILRNFGNYVWFMNFEITNTDTSNRKIDITGSSNVPERRGNSIDDFGTGTKFINLIIHDTGQGIGAWSQGQNNEYYGNIIFNNGWDGPDRLNGHGTYTQNRNGPKEFTDNIIFNQFGLNSRTGGTSVAASRNFKWVGNTFFNGRMAWQGPYIENLLVKDNFTYNNPFKVGDEINSTYRNAEVRDNYFMSGVQLFELAENVSFRNNTVWNTDNRGANLVIDTLNLLTPDKFSIDSNTYYKSFRDWPYWQFVVNYRGAVNPNPEGWYAFNRTTGSQQATFAYVRKSWQDELPIDQNSTYIDSAPTETKVFVRPNKYDSNRSNIIVYNWGQTDFVNVDAKKFLRLGDFYEIRNVQDYFGDVVLGKYRGGYLRINMRDGTRAKPIGYDQVSEWYHDPLQENTFPTFGAFVLVNKGRLRY